ncbi:SDR family oxidoreductase, partial [Xanthovirga aplysinae]|uniref:SDR family oxidoreductase n=1 Tax=Xanthovirga aplysinae TaxID=2529853 RepID=UPI0012BD175E
MSNRLNVLITGATSGFGRKTAEKLAEDGHQVFATTRGVHGKNADAVQNLEHWANERDLNIKVVELDVSDDQSVNQAISSILIEAGHLDVVVNNAAIVGLGPMEAYSIDQIEAMYNTNVFGSLRVLQAVLPSMRKRKSGLLIQVSSVGGRTYLPFHGIYNSTKWAVESIAEGLNYELESHGIESVIIEPGAFNTEIMGKFAAPDNSEIEEEYAEFNKAKEVMFGKMMKLITADSAPGPIWIADAIKKLVDMPAGERPIRTVIGEAATGGVRELNKAQVIAQRQHLEELGLGNWIK